LTTVIPSLLSTKKEKKSRKEKHGNKNKKPRVKKKHMNFALFQQGCDDDAQHPNASYKPQDVEKLFEDREM